MNWEMLAALGHSTDLSVVATERLFIGH